MEVWILQKYCKSGSPVAGVGSSFAFIRSTSKCCSWPLCLGVNVNHSFGWKEGKSTIRDTAGEDAKSPPCLVIAAVNNNQAYYSHLLISRCTAPRCAAPSCTALSCWSLDCILWLRIFHKLDYGAMKNTCLPTPKGLTISKRWRRTFPGKDIGLNRRVALFLLNTV